MAGDGHRFVEGGDLERNMVGDDLQTGSANGVFDQQELGECARGAAVADDAAGRGHGVDDDVVTDGDAGHVGADVDDFAGGFVTQWGVILSGRDAADRDVEGVGSANTAGPHADQDVVGADGRGVGVDDLCRAGAGHHGHLHQ